MFTPVTQSVEATLTTGGALTIAGALAVNGDSITADGATLTINAGGAVDIQDAVTVDSLVADTGNVAITSGVLSLGGTTRISNTGVGTFITGTVIGSQTFTTNNIADSGALTITSATSNALTLDSGTTGTVNLGTGNNAKTINIGTGTAGNTINIGTNNTVSDTITIGSALDNVAITGDQWSITDAGVLTVASCTGCGGTWNTISNPTGNQSLNFDDGEINTWTTSSDTETLHTITTTGNTFSTGNLLALSSSSTGITSASLITAILSGAPASSWTGDMARFEATAADADLDGNLVKIGYTGAAAGDGTALNVTTAQTGSSAFALRVNDDGTYTDSTPFVVDASGNVGIGDSTPSAKLEVGDGTDSLQISSVGDITFVDADGAASITGPAGGALSMVAGASQALTLTGNAASTWSTSSGALTLTSAAAATWSTSSGNLTVQGAAALLLTSAAGHVNITSTGSGNDILLNPADDVATVFAADGTFSINAASTPSTLAGAGVLGVNVNTVTSNNRGIQLDYTIQDASGNVTSYAQVTNLVVASDAGQDHTAYGHYIWVDNDDASSTVYGLYVDANGDSGGEGTEYAAAFMNGNVGIGTATPDGKLEIAGNTSASAWGLNGIALQGTAATYTDTSSSGTVTNVVANSFGQPTLAASSSTTYTNAANLYIANAPAAGSNVTLTNAYALWVDAGTARFDGDVVISGTCTGCGSSTLQGAYDGGTPTILTDASGDIIFQLIAGNSFQLTQVTSAPTEDMFAITNAGLSTVTSGVDGMSLTFGQGADAAADTNAALNISAVSQADDSGDIFYGANVTLTNNSSDGGQYGLYVNNASASSNSTEALVYIQNSDTDANSVTDYIIITKGGSSDTTADAIDVSDSELGNALNVGANTITGAGYTIQSTASGLTLTSDSADLALTTTSSGNITLTPAGDVTTTLAAAGNFTIDAASTPSTGTAQGIFDLNVNTVTSDNRGFQIDYTLQDAGGNQTVYAQRTNLTVDTDAVQSHSAYGHFISVSNSDASSSAYGLQITGSGSGITTAISTTNNISVFGATAVAGILQANTLTNAGTNNQFQFGNRYINTIASATDTDSTYVGEFIRMIDDDCATDCINTVRGLEVQAWSGTNNAGVNTGVAAYGKTFGIQGTTSAQASTVAQAAAVFADLDNGSNPTLGNAIRAYTNDATSAVDLVSLYQETSSFSGTGLAMNFGTGGAFTGNFIDLKVSGSSVLKATYQGDVTSGFTTLNGSTTANGSGSSSTTLILTSGTNFDVGNYVKVDSTDCVTGVNTCYAKITAKASDTLTISPALTWANSSTVTEVHVPEIGGTNTASTLTNRYGRGYFIDGIVTGNGSTNYTDHSIQQSISSSTFNLLTSGNTATLNVGSSGTTVTVPGTLSVTGTGASSMSGPLSITSTTSPQLNIKYDTSNYVTTAVASNGAVTIDATGSGAAITFPDTVTIGTGSGGALTVGTGGNSQINISGSTQQLAGNGINTISLVTGSNANERFAFQGQVFYVGRTNAGTNASTGTILGDTVQGTDFAGGALEIAGGHGSGAGNSGVLQLQGYTNKLGTGSTLHTRSTILQVGNTHSGQVGTTGAFLSQPALTYTDYATSASGTATNAALNTFAQSTIAALNSTVTTTNAFGLYLHGAPISGTNQTLTNTTALYVAAAATVDGAGGTPTNSYGAYINAQTGATNNYAAVFQGGHVGIGTVSPTAKLDVQLVSTSTSTDEVGASLYVEANPSSASSADWWNYAGAYSASGNAQNLTGSLTGMWADVQHQGTGTLDDAYGLYVETDKSSTGAITNAYGLYTYIRNTNATNAISNAYGVYIADSTETGTITNDYGIYQVDTGAYNFFGGNVGIGTATAPAAALEIAYSSSNPGLKVNQASTGYIAQFQDNGDNVLIVDDGGEIIIGDQTVAAGAWANSYSSSGYERSFDLAVYNDKLYAGQGNDNGDGDILMFDGSSWSTGYGGAQERFYSLAVFNGKLYGGQGSGANDADVFMCTPGTAGNASDCDNASDWTEVYSASGNYTNVRDLVAYNGKLYAAMAGGAAAGLGDVLVCTPGTAGNASDCDNASDWTSSYNGSQENILALAVFNGRLYAGQGEDAGDGDIHMFDGTTWTANVFNSPLSQTGVNALTVFNGKLYAGVGSGAGLGDIYVCEPTNASDPHHCDNTSDWTLFYDGDNNHSAIDALGVFNGKLYASLAGSTNASDIIVYDAGAWSTSYNNSNDNIFSFGVYNGKLYAGQGASTDDGDVLVYTEGQTTSYPLKFQVNSGGSQSVGSFWFEQDDAYNTAVTGSNVGVFKMSHSLVTTAGAYDVSEDYPTTDSSLSAGELVMADVYNAGHVSRWDGSREVLGVVSAQPGFLLSSGDRNGKVPVVLAGRVDVKVTGENGAIHAGDYLTPSPTKPGYAMKAIASGTVIGQALGDFVPTETVTEGTVLTFVNVENHSINNTFVLGGAPLSLQQANDNGSLLTPTITNLVQNGSSIVNQGNPSNAFTFLSEVADPKAILFVVQNGADSLLTINGYGDVAIKGVLISMDDTFAGSITTNTEGSAEITFSHHLGTGKPVVQLTAESEVPVFAQVSSWKQDENGNYTGFTMKTFGFGGEAISAIVNYNVTGKQEGYATQVSNIVGVTNTPTPPPSNDPEPESEEEEQPTPPPPTPEEGEGEVAGETTEE